MDGKSKRIRPKWKALTLLFLGLSAVLAGSGIWLGFDLYQYAHQPAGADETPSIIDIPAHETFNALTHRLKTQGIVTSAIRFKLLARITGDDKRLKAGEYSLASTMTPLQVLDIMVNGKVLLHRLVVPEGFTIKQIAAELARSDLSNADRFIALATDRKVAGSFGIEASTLEGYLFPDTYLFP